MDLRMIVALSSLNYAIGNKGKIPWHIKEDMKRFKELTEGHTVIMGRKTYESLKMRNGLPNRRNIVITTNIRSIDEYTDVEVYNSLDTALLFCTEAYTGPNGKVFIIGGEQLYNEGFDKANVIHVTEVLGEYEADTFFPYKKLVKQALDGDFSVTAYPPKDVMNTSYIYRFLDYTRKE